MRILFRYVFREFCIPLAYCLLGFVGIFVFFEMFTSSSRIASAHLSFGEIVTCFAGYLAPHFQYLASAALMLATLYTMWNFSRHSEIVAMRASGISLFTIVKPLLLAAGLIALLVTWVNECYMPEHSLWANRMHENRFRKDAVMRKAAPAYVDTRLHHDWIVRGDYSEDCSKLQEVQIIVSDPAQKSRRTIEAARADYLDGEWWLSEVKVDGVRRDDSALRVFPELTETPEDMRMQADGAKYCSVRGKLRYVEVNTDLLPEKRRQYIYAAWAQLLAPLGCLIVTLMTIPAGIPSGRQSVSSGIFGAIGLFFAYQAMILVSSALVQYDVLLPIPAAAAPHLVFAAVGACACLRSLRRAGTFAVVSLGVYGLYAVVVALCMRKQGLAPVPAHFIALVVPALAAAIACLRRRRYSFI